MTKLVINKEIEGLTHQPHWINATIYLATNQEVNIITSSNVTELINTDKLDPELFQDLDIKITELLYLADGEGRKIVIPLEEPVVIFSGKPYEQVDYPVGKIVPDFLTKRLNIDELNTLFLIEYNSISGILKVTPTVRNPSLVGEWHSKRIIGYKVEADLPVEKSVVERITKFGDMVPLAREFFNPIKLHTDEPYRLKDQHIPMTESLMKSIRPKSLYAVGVVINGFTHKFELEQPLLFTRESIEIYRCRTPSITLSTVCDVGTVPIELLLAMKFRLEYSKETNEITFHGCDNKIEYMEVKNSLIHDDNIKLLELYVDFETLPTN